MSASRRRLLLSAAATLPLLPLFGAGRAFAQGSRAPLALTPECGSASGTTPAQTEGPFFSPNTPLKRDFAADAPGGQPFLLAGLVVDAQCRPVPGALIELWHADEAGAYDNQGFRLRGHQFADDKGMWWFSTIVPALYPGRARHFHVKVQRPGAGVLTTQLYFPDDPGNGRDRLYRPDLQMRLARDAPSPTGRFDFVI